MNDIIQNVTLPIAFSVTRTRTWLGKKDPMDGTPLNETTYRVSAYVKNTSIKLVDTGECNGTLYKSEAAAVRACKKLLKELLKRCYPTK